MPFCFFINTVIKKKPQKGGLRSLGLVLHLVFSPVRDIDPGKNMQYLSLHGPCVPSTPDMQIGVFPLIYDPLEALLVTMLPFQWLQNPRTH